MAEILVVDCFLQATGSVEDDSWGETIESNPTLPLEIGAIRGNSVQQESQPSHTNDPLQQAQLTAEAVAQSTSNAVDRLSHHHSSITDDHTSSIAATTPQKTMLTKITHPTKPLKPNDNHLMNGFAHSTPVAVHRLAHPPIQARSAGEPVGFSPIEKVVFTAEQVAESTGESVHKLSQSISERDTPTHVH